MMVLGFKAHYNSIGLVRHITKSMTSGFSALNCQRVITTYLKKVDKIKKKKIIYVAFKW